MNQQIYEEASEWLVEFRTEELDCATRARFEKWLSKSPEHVQAYLDVSGIWETVGAQSPCPQAGAHPRDIDTFIERTRSIPNVVSLGARHDNLSVRRWGYSSSAPSRLLRRRALLATAATFVLTIIGASAYFYTQRNVYTTGIGEQRSILLSDGSTIDLDARSKIRVGLDNHERHIDLLEGQALFRVAKDKTRPFVVAAGGTRVRAVGTRFDVNQRKRGLIVTVVEGTVAVSVPVTPVLSGAGHEIDGSAGTAAPIAKPKSAGEAAPGEPPHSTISSDPEEILLAMGQQVTLSPAITTRGGTQTKPTPRASDIDTATAWTQRRLIFDATPLEDVAEEFNRNNSRPLVIEGAGLEDFHVSGAFSSTDAEPLLRFLRAQPGLRVTDEHDRIIVSRSE